MSKTEEVTQFVASVFDLYRLNTYEFFCDTEEDDWDIVDIPLFATGEIDDATLTRICIATGLSKKEILNCDENAKMRYWNKYPFFASFFEFIEAKRWYTNHKTPMEELLASVLYRRKSIPMGAQRYDPAKIRKRLRAQLKEIDEIVPGTYHKNARINNLRIETKVFFSFPEFNKMLRSFVEIMELIETLFFKALHEPLSEDEANELNFLATFFRVSDLVMPSTNITYDNILLYRAVYLEENYDQFLSYVQIRSFIDTDPWSCKEFFDDIELAQSFFNYFPEAKSKMKHFILSVSNFWCGFTWSDVKATPVSDDDFLTSIFDSDPEQELADFEKRHPAIYVPKRKEELYGWEPFIEQLQQMLSSPSQGGLYSPIRSCILTSVISVKKIQRRVEARHKPSHPIIPSTKQTVQEV